MSTRPAPMFATPLGALRRLAEPKCWAGLTMSESAERFADTFEALCQLRHSAETQRGPDEATLAALVALVDEWGGVGPLPRVVQAAAASALLAVPFSRSDELSDSGVRSAEEFTAIPRLLERLVARDGVHGAFVLEEGGDLMAAAGDRASLDVVSAVGCSAEARATELGRRLRLMRRSCAEVKHGRLVLLVVVDADAPTDALPLEEISRESAAIFDRLLMRLDAWAEPAERDERDDAYGE